MGNKTIIHLKGCAKLRSEADKYTACTCVRQRKQIANERFEGMAQMFDAFLDEAADD